MIDFNQWRIDYDMMNYSDQLDFYNRVETDYPYQVAFDTGAFQRFFNYIGPDDITVMEMGGWKGELANEIIAANPQIKQWLNYEISRQARDKTVCKLPGYECIVPADFIWHITLPPANVFVSSHAIEHVRWADLQRLFNNLPPAIKHLGLQAPICEDGFNDWANYFGSHILEAGWDMIKDHLADLGFCHIAQLDTPQFRAFQRRIAEQS